MNFGLLRSSLSPIPKSPRASCQDGRIYIEKINWPFLSELKGMPSEYKAGLDFAMAKGRLWLHESGTYVKITEAGAELFA